MANTYTTLNGLFTAMADAIRAKKNSTEVIVADNFPTEIRNLKTGFNYNNSMVTSIADNEFKNCEDLLSVDCIGVTSVGANAFEGCENLKNVVLYEGVTEVGENAFKGCDNVTIYCEVSSVPDTWHENWNPDNCDVIWDYWTEIETLNISKTKYDNVTATIFKKNDVYKIYINGLGEMKESGCIPDKYKDSLISVIICDGVTNIGSYAFNSCESLTSIIIPNSVTTINEYAFRGCTGLTSITIPDSVTRINQWAFYGCTGLTSVYITDLAAWCNIYFYDRYSNPLCYAENIYLNNELVTDVIVPSGVKNFSYTFYNYNNLTSVDIQDGVTGIGGYTFYSCNNLISVSIPDSVTIINVDAFGHCTSLTSITIPDSVTEIRNSAFYGCSGLISITIGNSIARIYQSAFYNCKSLTSITYTGTVAQWNAITFDLSWNTNTPDYTIHCTDGDIAKDGTITYHTLEEVSADG